MQTELSQLLSQKNRLAALGLAVSKINHDLRNLLANTQLLSDRLTSSPDPTVQRFAPKLIASLDRAITFCNDTLKLRPRRRAAAAPRAVPAAHAHRRGWRWSWACRARASSAGESRHAADLKIDADRDHLFRVLTNLVRNAVQAIEAQGDGRQGAGPRDRPPRRQRGLDPGQRRRPRRAGARRGRIFSRRSRARSARAAPDLASPSRTSLSSPTVVAWSSPTRPRAQHSRSAFPIAFRGGRLPPGKAAYRRWQ